MSAIRGLGGMGLACLGCLFASAGAQTGPGIPKIQFTEAEVGKRLFLWGGLNGRVPKMQMFQGYLMIFQNRGGAISSWDITDPAAPRMISTTTLGMSGDEHVIHTYGSKILAAGAILDMEDPRNPKRLGRFSGLVGSVWPAFQWPYLYTTRTYGGDTDGNNILTIIDYSDPDNPKRIKDINASSLLGYPTGGTHVVGNLLMVTSGDEFKGVSVWDISDPLNPGLLSASKAGPGMYTSQIYGRYIVTTGPKNEGVVGVWDYGDPDNLKLVKEQRIPNMGDYAHFQNGFMFGMNIFGNKFVKVSMEDYSTAFTGSVGGGTGIAQVTRYAFPMGNMMALGDPNEPTSAARPGGTYAALFVHDAKPDDQPPAVLFANPAPNSTRLALSGRIGLVFDEDLDNRTLTTANITVRAVGAGGTAALEGIYTHSTGIVNFTPAKPLAANTTYEVVVRKGGIKDWTGNAPAADYAFRFSTGANLITASLAGNPGIPAFKMESPGTGEQVRFFISGFRTAGVGGKARPFLLSVHDMRGHLIKSWVLKPGADGMTLVWNRDDQGGAPASPGVYSVHLQTPAQSMSRKLVLP